MSRNWFGFSHFPSLQNSSIRYQSSSGYASFTSKGMDGDLFDWIRRPKIISSAEENDRNYFIVRRRVDYGIEKEIERMKSSARVIAESLGDFGKCLRETELPNDVQTTEKVLEMQQHERDAIKEDFRISIRKGLQLLRQVRQTDESSNIDQHPSPCSLQNVAAIERMIAQLQDTEKSFDTFWQKHRLRLISCLELRRFEDEFRKLQNSFAKHMLRLEEQRIELGNSESSASRLILEHRDYRADAMADVFAARTLKERGLMLAEKELTESLNTQGSDSVGPKCEELTRMADALEIALEQRTRALEISRQMHSQIGKANDWCRRGVELLSSSPLDLFSSNNSSFTFFEEALNYLEEFIKEGDNLKMDALMKQKNCGDSGCEMMVLTSSDTSSLIAQVNERIDDIRRLSNSRRDALRKMSVDRMATINHNQQQQQKPIQIVSPEKNKKESKQQQNNGKLQKGINVSFLN
uniref:Guanine nucleotide exchange factor DBS-like spectrin-like domain-containing protein n=1 Tax=Meloidogyne hapla TaxID=6305 RepID=A0A1I8BEZ5_MELHA